MNIVTNIKQRISEALETTKKPCNGYKTEATAERAAVQHARDLAEHFGCAEPANYLVIYHEGYGKWIVAFDVTGLIQRPSAQGGCLTFSARKGFYSF